MKHIFSTFLALLMTVSAFSQMYLWKDGKYTVSDLDSITFSAPAIPNDASRVAVSSRVDAVQPMTGLVMWPSHGRINEYKSSISLEFHYCLPCKVVTGKKDGKIQYNCLTSRIYSTTLLRADIRLSSVSAMSTRTAPMLMARKALPPYPNISRICLITTRPIAKTPAATDRPTTPTGAIANCNGSPSSSTPILLPATTKTRVLPSWRSASDIGRSIIPMAQLPNSAPISPRKPIRKSFSSIWLPWCVFRGSSLLTLPTMRIAPLWQTRR